MAPESGIVLVVDDDSLVLAATSRLLKKRGMRTICANSPFGVCALVCKEAPDVVVLDCHMPGLDGAQLIRVMRIGPRTARIPVIFYSGDSEQALAALAGPLGVRYAMKARGAASLVDVIHAAMKTPQWKATRSLLPVSKEQHS